MNTMTTKPKRVLTRRQNITKTLQIKSAEELEGYFFAKEGNTILYPWFVLGKKWGERQGKDGGVVVLNRPGSASYKIVVGNETRVIKIEGSATWGVPSEFEYDVFHAILAINAIQKKKEIGEDIENGGAIEFTSSDIINVLGISDSGTNYKRVYESIMRLTHTSYMVDQFFVHKANIKDGVKKSDPIDEENKDSIDSYINGNSTIEVAAEMNGAGEINLTTTNFVNIRLFKNLSGEYDQDEKGNIIRSEFKLTLDDNIVKNMTNQYTRHFDIARHFRLKSPSLRRFYEIISFSAYKRKEVNFPYDLLSGMIPLSSGRMNKQYIIGYAKKLKEMGYIEDYDAKKERDKINIVFLSANRGEVTGGKQTDGSTIYLGTNGTEVVFSNEDANVLKLQLRALLNSRKITTINEEDIFALANDKSVNVLKLSVESIVSNIDYVLRRRGRIDNMLGYIRTAFTKDYSAAAKKTKEDKKPNSTAPSAEEQTAAIHEKKKRQRDAFEKHIYGLSDSDLNNLFREHGLESNKPLKTKKTELMVELVTKGIIIVT